MVDLMNSEVDFKAASLDNLSIITMASDKAGLSRGMGPQGAYTNNQYRAIGGSPFTLQYIGSSNRSTGDEIPLPIFSSGSNGIIERLVVDLEPSAELIINRNIIITSRFELLSGKVDIPFFNNIHLKANALWVQGVGILQTLAQSKFRFPDNVTNSTYSSSNTSYDLFYVNPSNATSGFEFTGSVRQLTIRTGGSKTTPVTLSMSGSKTIRGTLRIIDGVLNLDNSTLTIGGNLVVDGLHNANNTEALAANNLSNARVAGWFPTRKGNEVVRLNPLKYDFGSSEAAGYMGDGYGRIVDTNGTLVFSGSSPATVYALGYVQDNNTVFSLPNIELGNLRVLHMDLNQSFFRETEEGVFSEYRLLSFTQRGGTAHLRPIMANAKKNLYSDTPSFASQEAGFSSVGGSGFTQHWKVMNNFSLEAGSFYSWGATITVGGTYTQGQVVSPRVASVFYGGQADGRAKAGENQTALSFNVRGNFTVLEDKAADATPNSSTDNANVHRFYLSEGTLKVGGDYAFFGHADVTDSTVPYQQRGFRGTILFNGTSRQTIQHGQVTGAQPAAYKVQNGRGFFNHVTINNREGISIGGGTMTHLYLNES
jgi:hypothetical protein